MDETRFDQSVKTMAAEAGRREALRSLGAGAMTLLAALGLANTAAAEQGKGRKSKDNRRRDRQSDQVSAEKKKKKAKPGPAGPAGPAGPTGPTGPAGGSFTSVRRSGTASSPLPNMAGNSVGSSAFCNFGEQLLGCGFEASTVAAQMLNTSAWVTPDSGAASCQAVLLRTGVTGSAEGATITAHALCAVFS